MKNIYEKTQSGNPIGYLISNKKFNNYNEFKKEVSFNICTKINNFVSYEDIPKKCYLFTENGVFASIENNVINQLDKNNNTNWIFFKY